MARPESFWMLNELLYNLEGDPVSSDSTSLVHLVDYCLLSIKTENSKRDFLFQDMMFIPINAQSNKKTEYVITSMHNSAVLIPFKVEDGYSMTAKPLTVGETTSPALEDQLNNLASNKTFFVGDDAKGIIFKPTDIKSLKYELDSDLVDRLCRIPPSNRAQSYFLGNSVGKDSIEFYFTKDDSAVRYQFTFLTGHKTMHKSVDKINLQDYLYPFN